MQLDKNWGTRGAGPRPFKTALMLVAAGVLSLSGINSAFAVPSFARQTGLSCDTCHTVFPALTPFGRNFKLNGYTMTVNPQVKSGDTQEPALSINSQLPLSVMVQTSVSSTAKATPGQQNPDVALPDQFSMFFAGEITKHFGAFVQITYAQVDGGFGFDLADMRYANHTTIGGEDTTYGFTVNNGPTIEDLWNSTPSWGYPYVASEYVPGPAAGPFIASDAMQTNSAGVGVYAKRGDLYGAVTFYRSANQGADPGTRDMALDQTSPYARFAWSQDAADHSLEFGVFYLNANFRPDGTSTAVDKYTDLGIDGQYQLFSGDNLYEVHGSYINEKADWGATTASNASDTTKYLAINGDWYYQRRYGVTVGYFNTTGDSDCLIFNGNPSCTGPATEIDGSANGSPDSTGFMAEVDYLPAMNVKLAAQFTFYSKFNGGDTNYDGAGRSASDNDTVFLNAWFAF